MTLINNFTAINNGFVSVNNTTATPLAGGASWTGTGESVLDYASIIVSITADAASATDGLEFQFSNDNINFKTTDTYTYLNGGTCKTYSIQTIGEYFRVKYTNGVGAQSAFNLCSQYKKFGGVMSSHRIADNSSGQDDAALVKSILQAERAGGTPDVYTNIQATASGNLKVSVEEFDAGAVTDFPLWVARGLITGISRVNKFGAAPEGVQTTATDIWSRADSATTQQIWLAPTAARVHAIVSTSTNDDGDPAGTGARTIRVYGLKTWDLAETSEDITLNGTTPVNTAESYVIIHRMKVLTCGTAGPNVGVISATAATDGTITAVIAAGDGQTEMAIYGVPSTQTFYLKRWSCGLDKTAAAAVTVDFRLMVNENPNVQTTAFLRKDDMSLQSTGQSAHERNYYIPPSFAGPCIVKIQAIGSAADIDGESGFDAYIVTN